MAKCFFLGFFLLLSSYFSLSDCTDLDHKVACSGRDKERGNKRGENLTVALLS